MNTDLKNLREQVEQVKKEAQAVAEYLEAIAEIIIELHAEVDGTWSSSSGFAFKWEDNMKAVSPTHTHRWVWFGHPYDEPWAKPGLWMQIGEAFTEEVAQEVRDWILARATAAEEVRQKLQKAADVLAANR